MHAQPIHDRIAQRWADRFGVLLAGGTQPSPRMQRHVDSDIQLLVQANRHSQRAVRSLYVVGPVEQEVHHP